MHKLGRVVITTKDSKQLDNQIWPAIEAHKQEFPDYRFIEREVHSPDGAFVIGFTTDDAGRAEGWHKVDDFDGPLLIIADESKSIPEEIFKALDRCTYNAILLTSSPGLNEGRFYEAIEGRLAESESNPNGYKHLQIGLKDCPHIPKSRIDNTIADYGIDHPFTRSTLFGEFMDADGDTMFIFPRSVVKSAMESPPPYVHGRQGAFCDFAARGGNENVLVHRTGNKLELVAWRNADPMASVGRFILEFVKRGLSPGEIWCDAGGIGAVMMSRFAELGWPINGINNESPATNPIYDTIGAQMWHEGARRLGEFILPNDPIMAKQLSSRRMDFTSDALLAAESKKKMKERNIDSPDRADGIVGAINIDIALASTLFDEAGLKRLEAMAAPVAPEQGKLESAEGGAVIYTAGAADSNLLVWERPIAGMKYLCVIHPVKHGERLQDHVVLVLRAKFPDDHGKEMPMRLVARVKKPCKLDARPLAAVAKQLTTWYGRCFCVPISNERGDVIDNLLSSGMGVYAREEFESFNHGRRNLLTFGWDTDPYSRSLWIGALSEAIRENKLEVHDRSIVTELYQLAPEFADQRREAEAIGVGVLKIDYATTYVMQRRPLLPSSRPAETSLSAMLS